MILNKFKKKNKTASTTGNRSLMIKMVSSYSVFLLIIIILFWGLYYTNLNSVRDEYNIQNRAASTRDVEYFEQDVYIMEMFCRQLLQNSNFRSIMNLKETDRFFFEQGAEVRFSLAIDIYPESLLPIKEVFAYLPLTDHIVSPTTFCSSSFFYEKWRHYPTEEYENWINTLNDDNNRYQFIPMDAWTPYDTSRSYMYILDLDDLYFTESNAYVCFVIDSEKLSKRFPILSSATDNRFLSVLDGNGESIYTTDDINWETIQLPAEEEDFSNIRLNGKSVTLDKYYSEESGYTYYYVFPSFHTDNSSINRFILFMVAVLLLSIFGGLLITRLSRRNIAPIIELDEELQTANAEKYQLQEVVEMQRPIITSSYIQSLLTGTLSSEDEVPYIRKHLELADGEYNYNVLYAVAYNNSETAQGNLPYGKESLNQEEFDKLLRSSLHSFLGEPFFCFSPADRTYAILICHEKGDDDSSLLMDIQSKMVRLHEHLLDNYGIWIFAGIGRTTDSLMHVWECYDQASEAISYTTQNYFFFPYEIIKKKSNAFYYPPEISTKLIHFITSGNTTQVLELFNLIHQENIEERSLPINLLKYLLSDIRNTLLKARFALPANADPEIVADLDARFNEHLSFKLCEDLALILCRLFTTEGEEDNLIATIEKYIKQNYTDPSMGLNKISDEFRISESYFSHMFKEKTGVNFSTYLENIRMTEAARLIQTTDVSLNELYIAVGYNNSTSFRRAFKKVYGVTPSAMRENKPRDLT